MPLRLLSRRAGRCRMTDLLTPADLDVALERSFEHPVVLFKHSMTCPISGSAAAQVGRLSDADDPPVYRIVVQMARGVSNLVAERFAVRHESPQVIVVHRGQALYHTSHFGVQAARIRAEAAAAV
jgi:bacillithiol system protein YtxJ